MKRSFQTALFLSLALLFAACGGDDSAQAPVSSEVSAGSNDTIVAGSNDDSETSVAAPADESGSIRDIDFAPRLRSLEIVLKGTAEFIDENTVQMTFDDGSIDGSGAFRSCITANSILDEGMVLILVYPDGEMICE